LEFERTNGCFGDANSSRQVVRQFVLLMFLILVLPSVGLGQDVDGKSANELSKIQLNDGLSENDGLNENETAGESVDASPRSELQNRLIGFGLVGGAVLALMGLLFAYLRLDHATRGFYGGRLQLGAIVLAVAVLAICYFLWSQVFFR
jgi:hypothetical protein